MEIAWYILAVFAVIALLSISASLRIVAEAWTNWLNGVHSEIAQQLEEQDTAGRDAA